MTTRQISLACSSAMLYLVTAASGAQSQTLEGTRLFIARTHGDTLPTAKQVGVVDVIVGPGVEAPNYGAATIFEWPPSGLPGFVDIDISATSILMTATANETFPNVESIRFNLDSIPPFFIDVAVNPATDWAGFAGSRAMAFGRDVFVNLAGLSVLQGQKIVLDLNLSNVPEPNGAALGAVALAGLGALRRRRA